jgi:hypothetical protein
MPYPTTDRGGRGAHLPVVVQQWAGDVADFVAARLALGDAAAQLPERLEEECLGVMRLQAADVGLVHCGASS